MQVESVIGPLDRSLRYLQFLDDESWWTEGRSALSCALSGRAGRSFGQEQWKGLLGQKHATKVGRPCLYF